MTQQEREKWNRRYERGSHLSGSPDAFLVQSYEEFIKPLFPHGGTALDLAGGAGRHAIWLAQRGWRVTLADISEAGIQLAQESARKSGVDLDLLVGDACELKYGRARFDLIIVFYYLQRELFPKLHAALRPGGLLLYKTLTEDQPQPWRGPARHFLKRGELLRAFPLLHVLHYRTTFPSPNGVIVPRPSRADTATAELVAIKLARKKGG